MVTVPPDMMNAWGKPVAQQPVLTPGHCVVISENLKAIDFGYGRRMKLTCVS